MSKPNPVPKPVVLISMDGVGVAAPGNGNAVTLANTPNLDKYWPLYPHTFLEASGIHVGLPTGIDGNSEVGHMALGAGKIIFQELPRIDNAIDNKSFFLNVELKHAFEHTKKNKSKLHVIGIVGQGKVHGSMDHIEALIKMAALEKIDPDSFFIHAITDGRDSDPNVAGDFIDRLNNECLHQRVGRIATMCGRYFAMDRDQRWERTQKAYDLYTKGVGEQTTDFVKTIEQSYKKGKTDEFIEPTVILENEKSEPVLIEKGDAVIFANFRPDRAVQLTRAFVEKDFDGWERELITDLYFVCMTKYADNLTDRIAFSPEKTEEFLGKVLSKNKLTQLRIAESEKFAHVTYFFNVGTRDVLPGEKWVEIPSPKDVPTYDLKPEMSQEWVTKTLLEKLAEKPFDFVLVNFAGADMVGHTGVIDATVKSMEVIDKCIGQIVDKVMEMKGAVIITADHGNAEEMINLQTGEPDTKHSTNPVPVVIIKEGLEARELAVGDLADVAPTILGLLEIEKPAEMTGRDLLA